MHIYYLLLIFMLLSNNVYAESRIKDIVYFEGIRDNILVGYGLIVGLNGTGDNLNNSIFTQKGLSDFLERLGVNTRGANLKTKNIAAVTVTAVLPPFARAGSKINIDVATLGDAKSIKGGTLLATPMLGADGEVYAVAQGPVSISSKLADDGGKALAINPAAGYIANGAIVEKEIAFDMASMNTIHLALKNPDITTARAIETAINSSIFGQLAVAKDPGTVELTVPEQYQENPLLLLAEIENLTVVPDTVAKIIVDEASGTIVIGENVKLSNVAIAQGNLVVKINDINEGLFAGAKPAKDANIALLRSNVRLADLVEGLNALGVKSKDLITILKSVKHAGAMQAEIEVR